MNGYQIIARWVQVRSWLKGLAIRQKKAPQIREAVTRDLETGDFIEINASLVPAGETDRNQIVNESQRFDWLCSSHRVVVVWCTTFNI